MAPGVPCKLRVVLAERAHRLPAAAHQQIVDDARVRPGQRPEFGGQGEGQQKVLGRHLFLHLAFQPLLTLVVLAVRAVAMAAGMRNQYPMLTGRAFGLHLGAGLRAALLHGRECAPVVRRESVLVVRQEVGFEGVDDDQPGGSFDRPPGDGEAVHQAVDPVDGMMLGLVGQVGIAGGGEYRVMAENLLDFEQVDAGFDQVGCIAVAQTVRGDLFFRPQASTTLCRVVCTPPRSKGERALCAAFRPP